MGGVLAPDRTENGVKVGIDVIWLRDGRRRVLACIVPSGEAATVGEYAFRDDVLSDTLAVLLRDLASPLDLVLLDEIGRLELTHGGGYAPALAAIAGSPARAVAITVRANVVVALADRLAPLPLQVFDVTEDREGTLDRLFTIVRDAARGASAIGSSPAAPPQCGRTW